jgi:hypothetical protein
MRAISAVDSVSLAFQRTRDFLFRPFSWGTYLKLGLVAIITEGTGSNLNSHSSHHGDHSSGHGPMIMSPSDLPLEKIAVVVAAVLLVILLSFVVFYLITRLRFAFFHCLINNTKEIVPGWRLYGSQATRFFWLNVVVGICFLVVMAVVAIPFITGFVRIFHGIPPGGHPDFGLLLTLILPLIPIILLFILAGVLADLILRDWMLPHYALDDATAGEAWAHVWARIMAEKKEFFVYALLRVVLPFIAMVILFMVLVIPGIFLAGALAAVEIGLHSAFVGAEGGAAVAGTLLQVFFGVIGFGFLLLASICLGGPVSTGIREYALIFYGGRYQELGDALYPSAVPPIEASASRP